MFDQLNGFGVNPVQWNLGQLGVPGANDLTFPHLATGVLELNLPDALVRAAPVPPGAGRGEGQIAVWREGHPLSVRPGTKETAALVRGFEGKKGELRLGPDGLVALVYVANRATARPAEPENRDRVFVRALDSDGTEAQSRGRSRWKAFPCAVRAGAWTVGPYTGTGLRSRKALIPLRRPI